MPDEDAAFPSIKDIESTAAEFDSLADAVSTRLDAFLQWLNGLPGRAEVMVSCPHPNTPHLALGLQIARGKSGWQLLFCEVPRDRLGNDDTEWNSIEIANLTLRCAAIITLPLLLQTMHREQTNLVQKLREANRVLDELSKTTLVQTRQHLPSASILEQAKQQSRRNGKEGA